MTVNDDAAADAGMFSHDRPECEDCGRTAAPETGGSWACYYCNKRWQA